MEQEVVDSTVQCIVRVIDSLVIIIIIIIAIILTIVRVFDSFVSIIIVITIIGMIDPDVTLMSVKSSSKN